MRWLPVPFGLGTALECRFALVFGTLYKSQTLLELAGRLFFPIARTSGIFPELFDGLKSDSVQTSGSACTAGLVGILKSTESKLSLLSTAIRHFGEFDVSYTLIASKSNWKKLGPVVRWTLM